MKKSYKNGIPGIVFLILSSINGFGQSDTVKYFFEGHTYQWHTAGDKVDERLEKFDFSEYDGIWLGGDVCSEALLEYSTLEYIDNLFDLKHPNTHWAFGNHDSRNGNWIWFEELSGKKTYYTSHYKGITYMVLNSTLTPYHCEQLNDQYRIIVNLCDTIQESSHLIFLVHHWKQVPYVFSYIFTSLNLTAMETCYKLFHSEIIKSFDLKEKRFGFKPEVTAKVARVPGIRIYEVGISYYGRTYEEGKKIGWRDGVWAFWCVLNYNLLVRRDIHVQT